MDVAATGDVIDPPARAALPVTGTDAYFPVWRIWCIGRNCVEHAREMGHHPTAKGVPLAERPLAWLSLRLISELEARLHGPGSRVAGDDGVEALKHTKSFPTRIIDLIKQVFNVPGQRPASVPVFNGQT